MSKLTIKDIAKMAGVSPTAVSFVINNKEGVGEETRKRVEDVIKKTNFKPSLNSRRLFFKKSFNISIVVNYNSSPFDNLFYMEIAKGILEKSKEYGYNIVFTDISFEGNKFILPDIIKQNDTDGIIFLQDTEKTVLNEIDRYNIPCVVIDAHSLNDNVTSIYVDYVLACYTATRYLIDNGHKAIAFIGSSYLPEFYLQAFSGFRKALEEAQISIPPSWIQIDAIDEVSSYECMERILKKNPIPTAVFCAGDIFAIGAIKCSKDHGYRIPKDLSFTAVDDILLSRYIEPKLTTVRIDMTKMGILALELIVKKINGEQMESVMIESDNLIVRESVHCIK